MFAVVVEVDGHHVGVVAKLREGLQNYRFENTASSIIYTIMMNFRILAQMPMHSRRDQHATA
jgi:hypothetical protein